MTRVVLDTNVFIDAIFRGNVHAQDVLRLISQGSITLVVSDSTELELMKTAIFLFVKGRLSFNQARNALMKIMRYPDRAERVVAPAVFSGCQDPSDNKFFDLAVAANADCIISRNCHVNGAISPPVPVLSPWQFLQQYRSRVAYK